MSSWKSLPNKWRRVTALTRPEQKDLLRALVLTPLVSGVLRMRGYNRTRAWIDKRATTTELPLLLEDEGRITSAATQVERAARVWHANCLQRSLLLVWILSRQGIDGNVVLGVSRYPEDSRPRFHAWVEYQGRVINDRHDIRAEFQVFESRKDPEVRNFD